MSWFRGKDRVPVAPSGKINTVQRDIALMKRVLARIDREDAEFGTLDLEVSYQSSAERIFVKGK